MVVVEKQGQFLAATNFYLSDVPFDYEPKGMDRYEGLKQTLSEKEYTLSPDAGMQLLMKVALTGTAPDALGRSYSTQWSSIYDLSEPSLMLCADRDEGTVYRYSLK